MTRSLPAMEHRKAEPRHDNCRVPIPMTMDWRINHEAAQFDTCGNFLAAGGGEGASAIVGRMLGDDEGLDLAGAVGQVDLHSIHALWTVRIDAAKRASGSASEKSPKPLDSTIFNSG